MKIICIITTLFLHLFVVANYSFEKLTIMTCPIGCNTSGNYGGHYAVTRSLIEGLKKTDACFNYDPRNVAEVGDVVLVLSDTNALRQAIQFKRDGRIKKLLAGPNLVVWACDDGYVLASPEIDICIVPSNFPRVAYIEDS